MAAVPLVTPDKIGALSLIIVALSSCSTPAGTAQTDKEAADVARRISSPRQHSADGLVRAAVGTSGVEGDLSVVAAEDLHADALSDPLARLVFRVHQPGGLSGFVRSDPVTACYEALFNWYGVKGSPHRIDCPSGAAAILPTPLAPVPRVEIPFGFDGTLARLLTALPAETSAAAVEDRLRSALDASAASPVTGLHPLPPSVGAAWAAGDVGVFLWDPDGRHCLLGARIDGKVTVWRPARVQLQPRELSCDPQTALDLAGLRPSH